MNTGRIWFLVQRLEQVGARTLRQNVTKVNNKCSAKVNQFSTIACFGGQGFGKTQITPASATGFRYCTANSTVNKFDKNFIDPSLVATYDDIINLPENPGTLLIDVREPEELIATGVIPTSINIPLKAVSAELKLSPTAFQAKYGRKKPAANDPIIFTCRLGVRAGEAAFEAEQLGFKNVKNYVGSWTEYAENSSLLQ
ncbi:rhodanese domain-containing protein CG4456-like [Topomyia yanbarensis]|uniref:rhodanese domain-containing protein CG4456-like n=1 Tax=Topomyia yanbarensis TaxID=2498891 RepID=UPI00273B776B|nr:rhodanese domain-containing protein CG4456-like [Topomyia yanbarensis]